MTPDRDYYGESPEALLVELARSGDRKAFGALVATREAWVRNLMRRLCGDVTLADDLGQQVFLQVWNALPRLQRASRFGPWLKRIAVNTWLQYLRKNDPLERAAEIDELSTPKSDAAGIAMDLDRALAMLDDTPRLCIILAYHEGMTHDEIAAFNGLPVGTVKSHIRRGTQKLRELLSAYDEAAPEVSL